MNHIEWPNTAARQLMTTRQFESNARAFVTATLREMLGKAPPKQVVDRTTAELVSNFKPLLTKPARGGRGTRKGRK